jgi:DNA polymerase bacteriophage-type
MTDLAALLAEVKAAGHRLEITDDDGVILHPAPDSRPDPALIARLRRHKADLRRVLTTLYVDFETHSLLDLELVGARTYAEHPSTQVLMLPWAIGDGPVQLWIPFDGEMPEALFAAATDPDVRVVAHNYQFDLSVWRAVMVERFGWPDVPLARWDCTSFRARLARLPGGLDEAAKALNLPFRKNPAGKKLIKLIARSADPYTVLTPDQWGQFEGYARQDIEVMRAIDRAVPATPDEWRPLIELDFALNAAGMPADREAVAKLIVVRDAENKRLAAAFRQLAGEGGLTSPKQVAKFRARLTELGVDLPNLKRQTIEDWVEANPLRRDLAAQMIRNRLESSHSSDAKLDRIAATAAETGRVRDTFVMHGAHTGRWSGSGSQLQNLPRGTVTDPEAMLEALMERADGLAAGTVDPTVDPGWAVSIKEAIASCIRGVFKTPEGWVFVSADFGQIEHRVLCWLAGQDDKLDLYRRGEDVYIAEAAGLGSDSRDLGKLFTLSAGYGGSGNVMFTKAPAFGVVLSPEEADEKTARWRENNPSIVEFWYELVYRHQVVTEAPPDLVPITFRCFNVWRDAEMLFVQLPSGRVLKYRDPRLELDDYGRPTLRVKLPKHKQLLDVSLWHGAATENVVSAIATDILTAAMLTMHNNGVFLVGTIHDQVVALAPVEHAEAIRDHMLAVMQTSPSWAPDLPLAADAFINVRFVKPAKQPAHAPLAPSAAERWMNCPGSVLAEQLVERPEVESPFAIEGTEAHKIFAACLERGRDPAELTDDIYIIGPLRHALAITRDIIAGRKFKVEIRLPALPGIAKVWGTADVVVFDDYDRVVAIVDLKFGAVVQIEPNAIQVQIYGLLAAQQYGCPPDGLELHIVQPRGQHVRGPHRVHHISTTDLDRLFARLQDVVPVTEDPAAPRIAGEHCRFCAARLDCAEARAARSRSGPTQFVNPFIGRGFI